MPQIDVINAAAKSGVKRFIPSDIGTYKGPIDVPEYRAILGKKAQAQNLLEEMAKEKNRSMALFPDFGFDLKSHSATIYDSGNELFTAMSIGKIGKPIAAVFKHPEETKNRYVRLSAPTISQRAILAVLERLTNTKWDTATVSTQEARRQGKIKVQNGDYKGALQRGTYNELLEVEPEELDDVVRKALAWV
ncbi:hypothetical protein SGCOL_000275 [Colletotrichum sp. CLE4]